MHKTRRISGEMDGKISVKDYFCKRQWGRGCQSFMIHDPLQHQLFYLARYKANIKKLGSNSFSEPVHVINSKPHVLK